MTTLDQQIMEKVQQLDDTQKQVLLEFAEHLGERELTLAEWLDKVDATRQRLAEKYGVNPTFSVQELLDEVREERLNDIMGRP